MRFLKCLILFYVFLLIAGCSTVNIKDDEIGVLTVADMDYKANKNGFGRWYFREYYNYELVGWNKVGSIPFFAIFDENGKLLEVLSSSEVPWKGFDSRGVLVEQIPTLKRRKEKVLLEEEASRYKDAVTTANKNGYIDVIGLVPGVSTKAQVQLAKKNNPFVIGGYSLPCSFEYIEERLSLLECWTGKEWSYDTLDSGYEGVSNIEVYNNLLMGFTDKFGSPTINKELRVTKMGQEVLVEVSTWSDKYGNILSLSSMKKDTETGELSLKSYKKIQIEQAREKQDYELRKSLL